MYYVLIILLHRPFVADGHLCSMSRSVSVNSFMECASAASKIVSLLRAYDRAFSVRRAPYLISYATYVASTILVRIAAKRGPTSGEHSSLGTCLAVFRENQETNWAVRRANLVVRNVMKRLGVSIAEGEEALKIHVDDDTELTVPTSGPAAPSHGIGPPNGHNGGSGLAGSPAKNWLNIDEIIQSFVREAGEQYKQQSGTAQPLFPMLQQDDSSGQHDNSGGSFQAAQPLHYGPRMTTSRLRGQNSGHEDFSQMAPWQQPAPDVMVGSGSVDDLLFGFNGSALDSFPVLDWDPI
jgi:hypothetical protein